IGPVRSARPYLIDIAGEYNAVLLHAGACPDGFAMLQQGGITHLDQIYSDSYYWRSTEREAPNNLYTGNSTIVNYLEEVIGQEYNNRFPFKKLNITGPEEQYADIIRIPYWGGTMVSYRYDSNENKYYRYYGFIETPHILANNKQITASNIIVQYVKTQQKDNVGRLILDLKNRGRAQIFTGGIVVEGYWERDSYGVTRYYNNQGERIGLNPGQTWINLALDTIDVEYKDTRVVSDIN
ncbi:MAG: DUF3048 C-terminal domain-containing protein, partial [Halanaerobiales bacterium]